MARLFIVGHPGLYGGARTELHSQVTLWRIAFPEIELHIIPTSEGVTSEPLYLECLRNGIQYHNVRDYYEINHDDAVINFCSKEFLLDLEKINRRTKRVAFVNCMTFLFPEEQRQASKGLIGFHLYQREGVLKDHKKELQSIGATGEFLQFAPYFDASKLEFSVKDQAKTHIGRISRQDPDKFAANTLHIYEYIVSPKLKQGHFLGFDDRSKKKIGQPYSWIKTYWDQKQLSVIDFYDTVDFIVQPTDTMENLPRVGFEAMMSGKPLVVDNRGGWKTLIEHNVSGFLCNNARDFIYHSSRLAYEDDLRLRIAENARKRAIELSSLEVSAASWKKVFERLFNR